MRAAFFAWMACLPVVAFADSGDGDSDGEATADLPAAVATVQPGTVTPDSPHYDLELLYHEHRVEEGLKLARERMAANPNDPDIYWHVARFLFEQGEVVDRSSTAIDKKALYTEMTEVAEAGLLVDPGNPHLLFALGIAKGRLGTTRGVLASLFLAKDVEEAWLAVVASGFEYSSIAGEEVLPCDGHLTLGIFYRLVPDAWIVKALAGTKGDLRKSLSHHMQADQCSPGDIGIIKELGVTQLCIADKDKDAAMLEKGKATLERVLALPADQPTEIIDHKHVKMLLDDPSLACGYSRDGQQDLDTKQLEEAE